MEVSVIARLDVSGNELGGGFNQRVNTAKHRFFASVEIVPPKALYHPGRFTNFIAPRRSRIGNNLARNGIGGVRKVSTGEIELLAGVFLGHWKKIFHDFDIRQVLIGMIAGEHAPEDLLRVVVHVVVTVPGGADVAAGPVSEETRRDFPFPQATSEPVLVVIPAAFEVFIFKLDRGARPEATPELIGITLQVGSGESRQTVCLGRRVSDVVRMIARRE